MTPGDRVTIALVALAVLLIGAGIAGVYFLGRYLRRARRAAERERLKRVRSEVGGMKAEVDRGEELKTNRESWRDFNDNFPQ